MDNLLALTINGEDIPAPSGIPTGGLSGDGGKIIALSLSLLLIVAILLAFGFIVYGGINWITSNGDKTKVEGARKTITFAVIGLVLCFFAFFAVQFIGQALNIPNIFNFAL